MSETSDPSSWPAPAPGSGASRAEDLPGADETASADGPATTAEAVADPTSRAARTGCLVALRFDDPLFAQEAMLATVRLRARGHLQVDDAAIVSKTPGGKVRIQQTKDLNAADGALSGGWWGLLAGLFLANPLIGGALGAALGGLWGKLRDVGISDDRMRELGDSLHGDEAALFLLITDAHRWHALAEARRFPARVLHTTLSADDDAALRDALGSGVTTL
ncbi:DUF1269 domain-containing protein [Euzebya sp.]|uniref:DUF1269 domain-containing protein n=1 Tax=Euzebya sp. TaxID=1971409 RepID=UPI0035111BAA